MHPHVRTSKHQFKTAMRAVVAHHGVTESLAEAAFPAYAHGNPLIDMLFWQRLNKAFMYIDTHGSPQRVLDFGCGGGVFAHMLAQRGHTVIGFDVDYRPLEAIKEYITFPESISFISADTFAATPTASYDIIACLDVLEHLDRREATLQQLIGMLRPGGTLVVSGPTENILYQLGRAIAGKEFSGHYHHTTIADIKNECAQVGRVEPIARLYPLVPLFEVFAVYQHKN